MEKGSLSNAKRRLLELIKRLGPIRVRAMARALNLTEVAVRQHLLVLENIDLVTQHKQPPQGRGRPSVLWSLTPMAEDFFPDCHSDLAVGLIDAMREAFGADGLERLMKIRARDQLQQYQDVVPGADESLSDRLCALARQRTQEGYMAEVVAEADGSFLLIEHHCPICAAARQCSGLCSAELDLFRRVLGEGVQVDRVQHLLSDDDRCAYRIESRVSESIGASSPIKRR